MLKLSYSTKGKIYRFLTLYVCAASIIAFALSLTLFLRSRDKYRFYVHDFINHFDLNPITDVLLNEEECPSGYSPLLNEKWPGLSTSTTQSDGENTWVVPITIAGPRELKKLNNRILCARKMDKTFSELPFPSGS